MRPERAADAAAVFRVVRDAFGREAEARLVEALRASESPCVSLVAEEAGRVVGHVLFSPVAVDDAPLPDVGAAAPCMALAPLSVAPDRQRRGAGSALARAGLDACRALRAPLVFVLGHPAYYPRFGFEPAGPHGFRYGGGDPGPAFMVRELAPGAAEHAAGDVRYAAAFDALAADAS